MQINTKLAKIQTLELGRDQKIQIDVLRLDLIHPVISGNKWFKLRYYIEDALVKGYTEIASFGGAYSNHIVATASACKEAGLNSIGFIRGEAQLPLSPTLEMAKKFDMQLIFLSRSAYNDKKQTIEKYKNENRYWIPEGGYGILGVKGAASILSDFPSTDYTHIIAAVGSGTMMAGLLNGSREHQQLIGISSMKNNSSLEKEIEFLSSADSMKRFKLFHQYHFGGFAKHPKELIDFMQDFWSQETIPTDIVYTSKLFYAVTDFLKKEYFKAEQKILVIHSGGLQGNLSLPEKSLPF